MEAVKEKRNRVYTVKVPASDSALFRSMTKRMGWQTVCQREKKCGLDLALEDISKGNLRSFSSVEDMMRDLLSDD